MTPEELARVKIDKQLNNAGWDIVSRLDYLPNSTVAVTEALMQGHTESDYLLFVEGKAIAVIEAKKEENSLGAIVAQQAENYAHTPQPWYSLWFPNLIPLVYLANGKKIYFKNMLDADSEYEEITEFHTPKQMLKIVGKKSDFGARPRIEKKGLRDCQYNAEVALEASFKSGNISAILSVLVSQLLSFNFCFGVSSFWISSISLENKQGGACTQAPPLKLNSFLRGSRSSSWDVHKWGTAREPWCQPPGDRSCGIPIP